MEELVEKMDSCIAQHDSAAYELHNSEFHRMFYTYSRSRTLLEILENLIARSQYSRAIFSLAPDRLRDSNHEHREIVGALKSRNGDKASEIIRCQKETSIKLFLDAVQTVSLLKNKRLTSDGLETLPLV